MKPSEALSLVRLQAPVLDRTARLRARAHTIADVEAAAARALPRPVFDYIAGGADDEATLAANRAAFSRWRFQPRALRDVSTVDLSTTLFGRRIAAPLGFAPTGYTRMIDPAGEPAVAAAAAEADVPYVLSTMASTSLEDLAAVPPGIRADRWFQLYVWKDRQLAASLIDRAAAAGYRVLEVACDTHVSGFRTRDVRNGLSIPPALSPRALAGLAARPRYWTRMLASPMLQFANVTAAGTGYTIDAISQQFDPSVDWEAFAWVRERWPGTLVLKGPLSAADALRARASGADGVHLSNHGGRQLDRCTVPLDTVAAVRAATGPDFGIVLDSGIRHGADIAAALALGADAAFIGRAYLYGLAAAGGAGVGHVIEILTSQLTRTLQLTGLRSIAELRAHAAEVLVPADPQPAHPATASGSQPAHPAGASGTEPAHPAGASGADQQT